MASRLVIAHRGHKVGAPEQTLAAFRLAAKLGATMLEADLRFTRDGVAVLLHDAMLDRTTSGQGPIAALDWEQVAKLDAGAWFHPSFAGERVPRLDDLFDLADELGLALCIEAKGETAGSNAFAVQYAGREIARRGRLTVDVVASFDHAALAAGIAAMPGLRTAPTACPSAAHLPPRL